jgi:N-methylhydantoinase A/oxoprolinase/acetone carboxylase beta subunit
MSRYIIGIDTGGTCTDGALIDVQSKIVLATAKVPTTLYRLSESVAHCLSVLLNKSGISPRQVGTIAVSTTLATNSVVENKGARVGLFVIGYVKHFKLPVTAVLYLKGGHTIQGAEEEPLEIEYLVETLTRLSKDVDAYAVCSAMSMVNPAHELVAEKAISMLDGKPVFCSHRASDQAGMKERAATAALHAKLMPLMQKFIVSVGEAMNDLQLDGPLSIITGNGMAITPDVAINQSGVTVASGPACTALFGGCQDQENALVVDVGGTTTDIAMIEKGLPVRAPEGCTIGSWVTHMPSVDMYTGGIGGDSLVLLQNDGTFTIGPARVSPLCMAGDIPDPAGWIGPEPAARCMSLTSPGMMSIPKDDPILTYLQDNGAATSSELRRTAGLSDIGLDKRLEHLARQHLVQEAGFTPTDALHVLGRAEFGDSSRSASGAEALARIAGTDPESFCLQVLEQTEERIASLVINFVARKTWGTSLAGVLDSGHNPILDINFVLKLPIIGLGAAARYFLPAVAQKLSTSVEFPEHFEVGNAVGAAMSVMTNRPVS